MVGLMEVFYFNSDIFKFIKSKTTVLEKFPLENLTKKNS